MRLIAILLVLLTLSGCCRKAQEPPETAIDRAIEAERQKVYRIAPAQAPEPETEESPYVSPIDFEALWEANPDICGWLDIPGCYISYPILRHDSDNDYYLTHAENGCQSAAGCIYVETYNSRELTDPAVVIYGHHLRSGKYFGFLQKTFQDAELFSEFRTLKLYLPDHETTFRIFAAVPYPNTHLLYTYNFAVPYDYSDFVEEVCRVRSFSAQIDPEAVPELGTQLVILSTCLEGNNQQRYLVIGRAVQEDSYDPE